MVAADMDILDRVSDVPSELGDVIQMALLTRGLATGPRVQGEGEGFVISQDMEILCLHI